MASNQAHRAGFADQALRGRAADVSGRPEASATFVSCFGRVYWTTTGYAEILDVAFVPPPPSLPPPDKLFDPTISSPWLDLLYIKLHSHLVQGCQISVNRTGTAILPQQFPVSVRFILAICRHLKACSVLVTGLAQFLQYLVANMEGRTFLV